MGNLAPSKTVYALSEKSRKRKRGSLSPKSRKDPRSSVSNDSSVPKPDGDKKNNAANENQLPTTKGKIQEKLDIALQLNLSQTQYHHKGDLEDEFLRVGPQPAWGLERFTNLESGG
ncbi:uncharacterized protein LY79DRAFT_583902 [Colletotrichum navitas]|uniref:Uncharacterized protein n=1 Tax=Colletotrichum navitas TaxID=681940 RepID=A0AAD8PN65_9PEZI|nr:uncharacterized protein LY79DRAFT_583902 [Colletotrichum navitas]KAK1573078.1 hypothetical protein LY79DRAFT_583902 [Colletotrichum navitas]